jgi:hypothetical protein
MTLEEVKKEIVSIRNELAKVPQMDARLNRLLGMEELLLFQQKEQEEKNEKPLKVANKIGT